MLNNMWQSPRRKELLEQLKSSTPDKSCPSCLGMFGKSETVCFIAMLAQEGTPISLSQLDDDSLEAYIEQCQNPQVVELIKAYRAGGIG